MNLFIDIFIYFFFSNAYRRVAIYNWESGVWNYVCMACVVSSSAHLKFAAIGENFCEYFFFMDVSRVNLRRYSIVIRVTTICCARNMMCFVAQAQSFVGSADCCAIPLGLGFGESYFWGVGCGRAIRICISGCGIEVRFS